MKLKYIILALLILGAFLIIRSRGYDLEKSEDRKAFLKDFGRFVLRIFKNLYDITMYAIKKPWLPENTSITELINNSYSNTNTTNTSEENQIGFLNDLGKIKDKTSIS